MVINALSKCFWKSYSCYKNRKYKDNIESIKTYDLYIITVDCFVHFLYNNCVKLYKRKIAIAKGGNTMNKNVSKKFIQSFFSISLYRTRVWPDIYNDKNKDYKALRGDWENVGNTIRRESRNFAAKH